MREQKRKWIRYLPFMVLSIVGALGGYLYYRYVGCISGTCAISSNPYISTVYGMVMGMLLGGILTPGAKRDKHAQTEE